jgi:hypothetical protein
MPEMVDCPWRECCQVLLDVSFPPEQRELYERHVESCRNCQDHLDRTNLCGEAWQQLAQRTGDPTLQPTDPTLVQVVRRLVAGDPVKERARWSWLPALVLLVALGTGIAFQLAGGGNDPAGKVETATEYHEYHLPLRGRPDNLPGMKLVGPDADKCVRFEPAGLRITLPPGFEGSRPQVGLSTGLALKGDFEVIVSFEVLKLPEPADAGPSTPLTLWVWRTKPDRCITGVSRRVAVDAGDQFSAWATWFDPAGNQVDHKGETLPTTATAGRLRLVRVGGELSYYASEAPNAEFILLNQLSIGEQDLDDVRLIAFTSSPRATLDARFSDLHIRMGSLPPVSAFPKKPQARGWLVIAAVGVVFLLLFGLALFPRRRRFRAEVPTGTPQQGP